LSGVLLKLDQIAVRIFGPCLMGMIVADLASGDDGTARFDELDERIEAFDLKTNVVVTEQPRISRLFQRLQRFRRQTAAMSVGMIPRTSR
jgi:hypothetical protein